MKIAIVDANYTNNEYVGLAGSWLKWELERRGIVECSVSDADIVLITVSSQQGVSRVRGELRKIKNKRAKIILGGGACYAPAIFDDLVDVICVGEGKNFIDVLLLNGYDAASILPESWIPGQDKTVVPSVDFPWDMPPLRHPDGTVRLFGSRGCRFKCLFCQTGNETEFRTHPDQEKLQHQVSHLESANERIAIVTNDGADNLVSISGQQEFLSVTMKNLKKLMPITRATTKGVRIGVEGISERLRTAAGKKVNNEDLLRYSYDLLQNGVGVRWFFIPGLPFENDSDYAELRYLVKNIKKFSKGVVMMNFHSFIPMPATPLCIFPLVDEYWDRFDEFRRWFFHGPGFTRRAQIIAPNQYKSRLRRSMESMAATEAELRRGWWHDENKNWRVQYLRSPEWLRAIASRYEKKLS